MSTTMNTTDFSSFDDNVSEVINTTMARNHIRATVNFADALFNYGLPIIWLIGTTGNILALLVFSRTGMAKGLTGFLFRCLAIADLVTIQEYAESGLSWCGIDLWALHTWTCRVGFWCFTIAQIVSAWVLVAIAMERMIGIIFPHRAKIVCTMFKGRLFIGLIIPVAMGVAVINLIAMQQVTYYNPFLQRQAFQCMHVINNELLLYLMKSVIPWLIICTYSLFPFLFLFIFNTIIIVHLFRSQRRRLSMHTTETSSGPNLTGMTSILITISVTFLVLTSPRCMFWVFYSMFKRYIVDLQKVSYVLSATNHSINFILYCITGTTFRTELKTLCTCK